MPVPLFASNHDRYNATLRERLGQVIDSGRYILGPEVEAFEREFADYLGARHCVGVANGTDAITLALRALGVEPGDDVVLPSFTFYATAEATANAGANPVFCDVDPDTFCVTRETVERAMTPRTKAIVAVHLFGNVAPVPDLLDLGVPVLEDSAQAAGATLGGANAGALGHAATFSFFPSKNLFCLGDGGAVTTNDDEVAARVRRLRFHGSEDKQSFVDVGYNSRLDELQAAALRVLLPELDGWNASRRAVAAAYEENGLGEHVALPRPVDGADPVYHLYVVRSERAEQLRAALEAAGIGARAYYRLPVHLQAAMARWGGSKLELPGTEVAARENLALPMGSNLAPEAVGEVVAACRAALV
ncbi:MAG TPA: DegT/DnrJ/EryC1/StrS family aminotransferase [Thermoleophilaceae bacterium]|nr:DegT/DnrJ/EryC1/StrS family aminotransferase [Thermoleophilaceae bacterium]